MIRHWPIRWIWALSHVGGGSAPHDEKPVFVENTQAEGDFDLTKIIAERDTYRELYEKLLDRVMR